MANPLQYSQLQYIYDKLPQESKNKITNIAVANNLDISNPQNVLDTLRDFVGDESDTGDVSATELVRRVQNNLEQSNASTEPILPEPDEPTDQDKIEDLIKTENAAAEEFITAEEARRAKRRADLAGLLSEQRDQAFDVASPQILEQLGGRGLLHSSAVGEEFATEKSRLQQLSENILSRQSLSDVDVIGGFRKGQLGREIDIRRAGLQREFSLDDQARMAELARTIAQIQASSQRSSDRTDLFGNLIMGGATGIGLAI